MKKIISLVFLLALTMGVANPHNIESIAKDLQNRYDDGYSQICDIYNYNDKEKMSRDYFKSIRTIKELSGIDLGTVLNGGFEQGFSDIQEAEQYFGSIENFDFKGVVSDGTVYN